MAGNVGCHYSGADRKNIWGAAKVASHLMTSYYQWRS